MGLFKNKKNDIPRRRLTEVDKPNKFVLSNVFNRNRTLIGSTSNNLDNINNRSTLESPRTKTHHLALKRRKVLNILFILILCMIILWILISNFTAKVTISLSDVNISKQVKSLDYEKIIQDYFNNNPIGRFSFFLDQTALNAYVSSKMPEVLNVKQKDMLSIGETNFRIEMRMPVAGWKIDSKQYYVDSLGVTFEENYFSEPNVQIIDNSGISMQAGAVSVSNRFLSFVGHVVSQSKLSGYTVVQAILPAGKTRELEIKIEEGDYLVKLSIDRPAGEQIEDMDNAIWYFKNNNQNPSYIDVRVSGKAFYI